MFAHRESWTMADPRQSWPVSFFSSAIGRRIICATFLTTTSATALRTTALVAAATNIVNRSWISAKRELLAAGIGEQAKPHIWWSIEVGAESEQATLRTSCLFILSFWRSWWRTMTKTPLWCNDECRKSPTLSKAERKTQVRRRKKTCALGRADLPKEEERQTFQWPSDAHTEAAATVGQRKGCDQNENDNAAQEVTVGLRL